ncbi:hypothetical protein ACFVUS_26400 [Nocardia sp. NPDC058058]|uniref:hypothetical protein n=1 Tax=Nocardia sp. NPDC058058 TaxID=3346317 RepID=UPI0036DEFB17
MNRVITLALAGIALTGFAIGTAEARTIDGGTFATRAACEYAGKTQVRGEVLGYRCSATSPNSATGDYYYALYLETRDANRPCQTGGTGSAAASSEAFCLFQRR